VLPQFFQARVAHDSTVPSRCQCYFVPSAQYGASARQVCVRLRSANAAALRKAESPKSGGRILLDRVRSEKAIGRGPRASLCLRTCRYHHSYLNAHGDVTTNKGHFSIFKCGMRGMYQNCSEKHLYRHFNICHMASELHADIIWVGIYPMLVYAAAIASSVLAGGMTAQSGQFEPHKVASFLSVEE
jgi:hypothetical protein